MEDLWRAIALVLIIEGLMPTLMPEAWRETLLKMSDTAPGTLRVIGIISIAIGAVLFHFLS